MKFPDSDTHFSSDAEHTYQREIYDLALAKTPQRRHALDLGAHCGIFTRRLAQSFDRVSAFEPVWFRHLMENTQEFDNCIYYACAVGNSQGSVFFDVNPENTGATHISSHGTLECEQTTVDDRIGDLPVDFIKLDLEGWEYLALQGAERVITQHKPTILIEMHRNNPHLRSIGDLLRQWGYLHWKSRSKDQIWLHCER